MGTDGAHENTSYYSCDVQKFIMNSDHIFANLTRSHQFDLEEQQRNSWIRTIEILKKELRDISSERILFEYSIPKTGKRADVILILNGLVLVIGFLVRFII